MNVLAGCASPLCSCSAGTPSCGSSAHVCVTNELCRSLHHFYRGWRKCTGLSKTILYYQWLATPLTGDASVHRESVAVSSRDQFVLRIPELSCRRRLLVQRVYDIKRGPSKAISVTRGLRGAKPVATATKSAHAPTHGFGCFLTLR